jgi:hypothetical protein
MNGERTSGESIEVSRLNHPIQMESSNLWCPSTSCARELHRLGFEKGIVSRSKSFSASHIIIY